LILDELQKISQALAALDQKVTVVATGFDELQKKVAIIERKVSAISTSQADLNQNKESVVLSLQFIKEELNDLKNDVRQISDKMTNFTPTMGNNPEGGEDNDLEGEGAGMVQSPESIYFTAYSDYLKKNYDLAIKGFKEFISLFPQNGLADNSLYWIGECYYAQRMFQDAVSTFGELIDTYNDGDKIPAATLKKGFALIEMGSGSEGMDVLKGLISRFPLSEEASLAQQKIKEISD
jgi:tol-pal system protein YbgF